MLTVGIVVVALALLGHAALWVGVVNRWHGTGFRRWVVKTVTLAFYAALISIPPAVVAYLAPRYATSWQAADGVGGLNWATAYTAFCAAYGAVHLAVWAVNRPGTRRLPGGVRRLGNRVVDVAERLGASPARGPRARLFCSIPFNQLWQLHLDEFEVAVPGLPPSLAGLSICHLSDLHFSGRIDRGYFDEVVRLTNAMQADLIVLTGDVCDRRRYIEWIPATLGRLEARLGKFFILGNHDLRTRAIGALRAAMCEAGFTDVGGRHETLGDAPIAVAGNERPWFSSSLPTLEDVPSDVLKILLAHTPDQLKWARANSFDLMFAGHTHGGQVCFPLVGPVICPSWYGTKYAAGFFREFPTVLHVSRGTGSLFPYRLNCPPEITKLVLVPAG
ncbi:MAG: metallophosphoesterase [Pirellulales bacterium]